MRTRHVDGTGGGAEIHESQNLCFHFLAEKHIVGTTLGANGPETETPHPLLELGGGGYQLVWP